MKIILLASLIFFSITTFAQVGIGTTTPDGSAKLDVNSTDKGFLPPRLTTAQRDQINLPAAGLMIYNSTLSAIQFYTGTAWITASSALFDTSSLNLTTRFQQKLNNTDTASLSGRINDLSVRINAKLSKTDTAALSSRINAKLNTTDAAGSYVPYTGATGAVNLGAYDLTVNGLTIGKGASGISTNTAIGLSALASNTSGLNNTANGYQALKSNTIGNYNIANGSNALYSNISGSSNIASGYQALYSNTTGFDNIASGVLALTSNTTGGYNIASGSYALYLNTTGTFNTAIGFSAGENLTTGSNNTLLGNYAAASSQTVSNEITLGNSSIASLRAQVTSITALSDRRDKTNIIPIGEGLEFLKKLNPVSFTWNTRDKAKVGIKSAGFIAQELLALQKQSNIGDNLDLVSENNPEKLEARYGNLLPIIVKAIQEESAEKDKEIKALKERINALEKLVNQIVNK